MFLNLFLLNKGTLSNYYLNFNYMKNKFYIKHLLSCSFQEPPKKIIKIEVPSQSSQDIESNKNMNRKIIAELLSLDVYSDKVTIY